MSVSDVVIVGAGPSGLATAIAAERHHLSYTLLEKGTLVNSIFHFPSHMVFFTTPERLEIGDIPFLTPYEKPTRLEALKYYRRVADTYRLRVEFGQQVLAIERQDEAGRPLFNVRARTEGGAARCWQGRSLVLATGYYDHPNLLGVPGEDLPHVQHYYTDAHPFFRKHVVVVGGGNSAAEAALDLYRNGAATVTVVHRHRELNRQIKYWVLPDIVNRLNEGSVHARLGWRVVEIRPDCVLIACDDAGEELRANAVLLLTGYHPDRRLLEAAGVHLDPVTAVPQHDPDTLETNVRNLFLAGGVIAGTDTVPIFIETGRLHGDRAVRVIGDRLREGAGGGS
jgi:thioredoxin reductase (NADPH)